LSGNPDVNTALLNARAEVNARNKADATALMFAARCNHHPESSAALLKAGAIVDARLENGITALMIADWVNSNPQVLITLLDARADASARDEDGKRAIDYARKNKNMNESEAYWKLNDLEQRK
jgi:ankyrin repeat protein